MEPNLHIIQYKGRSATNNSRSSNFTISLTGEASRSGFLLQPEISKFSTDSVDSIQVGIITLRPSDKDLQSAWRPHAASLVLEHADDKQIPSTPDSIRYDHDGELVNYKTNQRPKLEGFDYDDIISAEIIFSQKTIEYFKNGKSILKLNIQFKYPWYFAIWAAPNLKCNIKVIQDQNELMKLRNKHQTIPKHIRQAPVINDDSKCNSCDQLKVKMNVLQTQNSQYQQEIIKLKMKNLALNDECKEIKLELENFKIKYNELKKKVKLDINDFMNWSGDDVADWILSLNENRFGKYAIKLRQVFNEQNIDGSCLCDVVKSDITEWGIKDFKDKTMIWKQIASNFQTSDIQSQHNDVPIEGTDKTQYI